MFSDVGISKHLFVNRCLPVESLTTQKFYCLPLEFKCHQCGFLCPVSAEQFMLFYIIDAVLHCSVPHLIDHPASLGICLQCETLVTGEQYCCMSVHTDSAQCIEGMCSVEHKL